MNQNHMVNNYIDTQQKQDPLSMSMKRQTGPTVNQMGYSDN